MLKMKNPVFHHLKEPKVITKLHLIREEQGLSIGYLAYKSGIPKKTIMYYEYGKMDILKMPLGRFIRLCKALNCKAKDLIGNPQNDISNIFNDMI